MEKIVIKYKGYNAELIPIRDSCSNYNTMLHVLAKNVLLEYQSKIVRR